jgi:hypothetical protein
MAVARAERGTIPVRDHQVLLKVSPKKKKKKKKATM